MRIVTAFRRIEPYTQRHIELAAAEFDWIEALRMLQYSARVRARVELRVLTCDDDLPLPHFRFETSESKLMLWILDVSRAYIESEHFDQDTIFLSSDCLVRSPLSGYWANDFDIALAARDDKFAVSHPLLNGFQLWPVHAKQKLGAFFRKALEIARDLPAGVQRWGADTAPLVQLLGPIEPGLYERAGMRVRIFEPHVFGKALSYHQKSPWPEPVVIAFVGRGKLKMREYFERMFP